MRVRGGVAHYCNAFVRTPRLAAERRAGRALYSKIGDMQSGAVGLLKLLLELFWQRVGAVPELPFERSSVANTNVIFFRDRVWALVEPNLPLRVRIGRERGEISSAGFDSLGGRLAHCMTAHPKLDPRTGALVFVCAWAGPDAPETRPVTVRQISADGRLSAPLPVPLPSASEGIGMPFMHEMAISASWVILLDGSLRAHPQGIVQRGRSIYWERGAHARFGLVPRAALEAGEPAGSAAASPAVWCSLDAAGHIFHVANAWEEEGGRRVLVHGCWYDVFDPGFLDGSGSETTCSMVTVVLDADAATAQLQRHSWAQPFEFPRINDAFAGAPNRYAYVASFDRSGRVGFDALVKYDLVERAAVARAPLGAGMLGGEASYVPPGRADPLGSPTRGADEDRGHLGLIVFDEARNTSQFRLYAARDLSLAAVVQLPRRVPFGFHTAWLTGEQLDKQTDLM